MKEVWVVQFISGGRTVHLQAYSTERIALKEAATTLAIGGGVSPEIWNKDYDYFSIDKCIINETC